MTAKKIKEYFYWLGLSQAKVTTVLSDSGKTIRLYG
jgi:hypothetical protein